MNNPKIILFSLGNVVVTRGVYEWMQANFLDLGPFLEQHSQGNYGTICQEDAILNTRALIDGSRIMSAYDIADRTIWIITDATNEIGQRETTTILFPDEY